MEWPDKLYLQREGGGTISGYWQTLPLNANDARYVLSEIVAAREIEIVWATLEAVGDYCYRTGQGDLNLQNIDPATILKELGGV